MKKKIALLLLLMLALTTVLAACTQAEATKIVPRWDEKIVETYEYTVTLADFNLTDEGSIGSPHFRTYDSNDGTYYKDFDVRAGEPFDVQDEVCPTAVSGTLTLTISHPDDEYDLLRTKQELKLTYDNKDGNLIDKAVLDVLQKKGLVVANSGNSITLKSTTETTVEFRHKENQAPRKSSTKVEGFYLGKVHQEVSIYEVETEYTYEGKNTIVSTTLTQYDETMDTDKTTEFENTLKRRTEGSFIDSNQLFTYARSLDKSSTSFQNSPSVSVYNPFNQSIQTANFAFTYSNNAILTDATRGELYTKLPTLGIIVDGMAFMLQESVPNLKEKLPDRFDNYGYGPDSTYYGQVAYAKHTPVRFRAGYISYELTHYEDDIWNALKALVSSEK
ncbi:MAG: hypothetical protein J1F66_00830 [Clostridiales bacterium]|nr:hypothetical protein [Clostridiales bacterium]